MKKIIEIRTHPITGRTVRIALSRMGQSEPGTDMFPEPSPDAYFHRTGRYLFSDCLSHEKKDGSRYIGRTGNWEWMAAFTLPEDSAALAGLFWESK